MTRSGLTLLFPLFTVLLITVVAAPVVCVLLSVTPAEVTRAFLSQPIRSAVSVSLAASLGATAVATILGVPAGYALAQAPGRVRALAFFFLALPLAFPPVASGVMLLSVFGTHAPIGGWFAAARMPVPDSLFGVATAEFFVSGSFVAITAAAAFSVLDPIYADAARTLGASEWKIFFRVALPAAASTILAGIAFAWLRAIGEYGATSIVAYHPTSLPVALYVTLAASGVRQALALCYGFLILVGLVIAMQWILRRRIA